MFGNLGKIMKIASEMKTRMPEMKEKLANERFTVEAGEGAVSATVSGRMELVELAIDPAALAGGEDPAATAEQLSAWVQQAVSAAQAQAAEAAQQAMAELTGGMELPGMEGMM